MLKINLKTTKQNGYLKVNKRWKNKGELNTDQPEEDPSRFIIHTKSKWAVDTLLSGLMNELSDFLLYCLFRSFQCFHSHVMGIILRIQQTEIWTQILADTQASDLCW